MSRNRQLPSEIIGKSGLEAMFSTRKYNFYNLDCASGGKIPQSLASKLTKSFSLEVPNVSQYRMAKNDFLSVLENSQLSYPLALFLKIYTRDDNL